MKVNYKRIGDSFTLDEYNALVYLLKQDEWIEVIKLSKNGYDGKYANYTLYDPKNALVKKPYGFDIVKPLETVYLKVKSKFNCSFIFAFFLDLSFLKQVHIFIKYILHTSLISLFCI